MSDEPSVAIALFAHTEPVIVDGEDADLVGLLVVGSPPSTFTSNINVSPLYWDREGALRVLGDHHTMRRKKGAPDGSRQEPD
jgi:hypothetical protein